MFYNCNELKHVFLGNNLTTIDENAFGDCEKLEGDLVVPASVKTIGQGAFNWGWYYVDGYLILNEGLTTIGERAFAYCPKLKVSNIPSTVKSVGHHAFDQCRFDTLTIPGNVTSIGEYAFGIINNELILEDGTSTLTLSQYVFNNGGSKFKKLYLGRNIIHNDDKYSPFEYQYATTHTLQEVVIGEKVTSIPAYTFNKCSAIEKTISKAVLAPTLSAQEFSGIPIYVPAGSKASYLTKDYWKNNIIIDPSDELITVNLTMPGTLEGRLRIQKVEPANVNKLKITGEMNDNDWAYIKKTIMPNMYSVDLSEVINTSIPAQQFQSHTYLVNAILPNGITAIGDNAFEGSKLSGDFTMPYSLEQIGNNAFKGTKIGNVSLSSNVIIGNYAFNNSNLKSITLNKCTSIGTYAFADCAKLNGSYQLSPELTTIPDYAFSNCSNLEGIILPYNLKSIGNSAFANCKLIKEIEFHSPLATLGATTSSFAGCSGITSIKTHWTRPISTIATTFANVDKAACTLYVPENSTDWYLLTTGWDEFVNVVEYDDAESDIATLNLIDGENFSNDHNQRIGTLTFTKSFSTSAAGNWNAFYVPISVNVEDYADKLDFAEVYAFCAMKDTNEDGIIDANDENFLYVCPVKTGCTKPNVPYLIRPKEAKTYVINSADNILYKAERGTVEFSTSRDKFTVTGLYEPLTVVAGDNNYYVSASGALSHRVTGSTTVKSNRWIMHRESNEYGANCNSAMSQAKEYRIVAIGEDVDEVTAIETIRMAESTPIESGAIYTLDGRRVDATQSQQKGIYINNGKKIIIK